MVSTPRTSISFALLLLFLLAVLSVTLDNNGGGPKNIIPTVSAAGCGEPLRSEGETCTEWQCARTVTIHDDGSSMLLMSNFQSSAILTQEEEKKDEDSTAQTDGTSRTPGFIEYQDDRLNGSSPSVPQASKRRATQFCVRGLPNNATCTNSSECYFGLCEESTGRCVQRQGQKHGWEGYAAVFIAVLLFGSNMVPSKYCHLGNSLFFQLTFTFGMIPVGIFVQLIRKTSFLYYEAMIGGVIWAFADSIGVPAIRFVGLGLAATMWNATETVMGWASGKFGLLGVEKEEVSSEALSYVGVLLSVCSIGVLAGIKPTGTGVVSLPWSKNRKRKKSPPGSEKDVDGIINEGDDGESREKTGKNTSNKHAGHAHTNYEDLDLLTSSSGGRKSSISMVTYRTDVESTEHTAAAVAGSPTSEVTKSGLHHSSSLSHISPRAANRTPSVHHESPPPQTATSTAVPVTTVRSPTISTHENELEGAIMPLPQELRDGVEEDATATATSGKSRRMALIRRILGVTMAAISGLLFGIEFNPTQAVMSRFKQKSYEGPVKYSPDGLDYAFSFYVGIFVTALPLCILDLLIIERIQPHSLFPPVDRNTLIMPGFLCGFFWAIANCLWFVANTYFGLIITYPIVAMCPSLVSCCWGIFWFKEIKGLRNFVLLGMAFVLMGASVTCTLLSKK